MYRRTCNVNAVGTVVEISSPSPSAKVNQFCAFIDCVRIWRFDPQFIFNIQILIVLNFFLVFLLMASATDGFIYDVFLSFRGEDTRYGFTGNLWKALHDRGINTFIDDEDLRKGGEITPSLVKAIEDSRMAIVVLSENYASSSFCLQELSTILDFIKGKGRSVWPVFYEVDPSDVRKLTGAYGEAMTIHKSRYNDSVDWLQKWKNVLHQVADLAGFHFKNDDMDRFQKWKMALHQVANLSGFHYKNGDQYEHEFIGEIVERVSREIKPVTLPVADYLVGLESQKQNALSLLNVGSGDRVLMVGIHGIGGIGKTTLALAVYNSIADQFEGLCFLENVRENSEKHGLPYLQKILLSEMVGEKKIELTSVKQGISVIQQRLRQKKVLLILDDVDKREQLEAIVGKPEWFGPGSRVIITTRDKHLLTCHGVESTYGVKELNKKDAFELLRWKAFKTDKVSPSYGDVFNRAVTYASGLPLALEVIGSHLFTKTIEEWKSALDRYERIPNKEILKILKVSFDALEEEEKNVFLDIACCFKGHKLTMVEKLLHAHHGDSKNDHIRVLVAKSLIKVSESGNMTLHDLIEDMGKEIVRQESPKEPGKRSRLWSSKDIIQVLEENTGTSKIDIIYLDSQIQVKWDGEALKKMESIRTLIIRHGVFSTSPKHLPNSLRILEWVKYPTWVLPSDFHPKKLVIFKLDYGDFTSSVLGDLIKKKFENMRVLNLDHCSFLTQIPNVSGLPNLKEFSFRNCENLIAIDDSVGLLDKLEVLVADHCQKLRSFPPLKLASLEQLDLSYCGTLESFPSVDGLLDKLKILSVKGCCNLKSVPTLKLASLEQLNLSYCVSLESFPPVDGFLCKLKILSVKGCNKLRSIPRLKLVSPEQLNLSDCGSLESSLPVDGLLGKRQFLSADRCQDLGTFSPSKLALLEQLDLSYCVSLESFPPVDGFLCKLKILSVKGCSKLKRIPPLKLASLEQLDLSYCVSLESFPPVDGLLCKLKILNADNCQKLRSFPPLQLDSLEQLNLSYCVSLESFPPVDGLLGKLKILSVKGCSKLRSIPPLKLPLLEQLNLSNCDSLESFPEILGEIENITQLHLNKTPVKELPFSFWNLTRLQTLYLSDCGIVKLPSSIVMMSKLAKLTIEDGGWLFPKQYKGQEVCPVQSSQVEFLHLRKCNLSNESMAIGLKWFANVKELYLSQSKFTVLPECIKNCRFLWMLVLDNCEDLQEIQGIPPTLKTLSALNCKSLASSCKSKLLNQELHEAGNTNFLLPQAEIPMWFDHQCMGGSSISFWFRNKFPAVALCCFSPWAWKDCLKVIINGKSFFYMDGGCMHNHLHIFHMQMEKFSDNPDKALLNIEWNHVEVYFGSPVQKSGIHVLKKRSNMNDIRF